MSGVISDRFEAMLETMANVLASGDEQASSEWCQQYRRFRIEGEARLASSAGFKGPGTPELSSGVRQRQLAIHLLEPLQTYLAGLPRNTVLDGLDADCGYGYGTDLIASLYLTSVLGYRIRMAACLGEPVRLNSYVTSTFRSFVLLPTPLAKIRRQYNIVFSIFQLQRHLDPSYVANHLRELAKERVFLIAPFEEPTDRLTPGHKSRIDLPFLEAQGAENIEVIASPAWGAVTGRKVVRFQFGPL